jgi:hypothetical protein
MTLSEAQKKGKTAQFFAEQQKNYPKADKRRFTRLLQAMTAGNAKATPGTSRKRSRAS